MYSTVGELVGELHLPYSSVQLVRSKDFFHKSSEWFDWTEPSQTTSLQGIQGVQGAICASSGRFKRIEAH